MPKKPICSNCGRALLDYHIIRGYVYVLSNPSMPGLLKVGCTNGKVSDRARQLSNATAVPSPFKVEAYYFSTNPKSDEATIHQHLMSFRVRGGEFFKLSVDVAISEMKRVLGRDPDYHHSIHGEVKDI